MSAKIRLVENATDTQARPTISRRWLIFLAITLVVVILFGLFLLSRSTALDGIKRFFRYGGAEEGSRIVLEHAGKASYCLVDDRLCVGMQDRVAIYAEDGSLQSQQLGSYPSGRLMSRKGFLLAYDIGGKHLAVTDSDGKLSYELETSGLIYDADLSESGAVCVLSEGTGCRAALEVYHENGTLLFRRNSKTNYLNTCALSPAREYVAAATLSQENISFCSSVQIFDTASDTVYAELSLGNQLIYDLYFLNDTTLCAIGERSLVFFNVKGERLGEYADSGEPAAYGFGADGFVFALYDSSPSGGRCRLLTLDTHGVPIAAAAIDAAPLSLSACGKYVAVLTDTTMQIFNRELEEVYRCDNSAWRTVLVCSDATAYCIASGEAVLLIP